MQKLVLEIELVYDSDGITSTKDVKHLLEDVILHLGQSTVAKQVNGKISEQRFTHLCATSVYKDRLLQSIDTREPIAEVYKWALDKFGDNSNIL